MSDEASTHSGTAPSTHSAGGHSTHSHGSSRPAPGIQSLVRTTQFVWFVGHVLALSGALFFSLFSFKVFRAPSFPKFWYREAYVAIIFTFSIIINQTYRSRAPTPQALIRDDNVHYVLLAFLWLFTKPSFWTLPPFVVFSLFHVLTYTRSYLLPALGHGANSPLSAQIGHFVTSYNDRFMMLASSVEFFQFFRLGARVLTFRKGTVIPFVFYFVFLKLRYDSSIFTRSVVKQYEVRIDGLLSHPSVPVPVRDAWLQFKHFLRQTLGTVGGPHAHGH